MNNASDCMDNGRGVTDIARSVGFELDEWQASLLAQACAEPPQRSSFRAAARMNGGAAARALAAMIPP